MFKNISNFLFNQFGGLSLDAPKKSINSLSLSELKEYIETVCESLAKQLVAERKSVADAKSDLEGLAKQLLADIADTSVGMQSELASKGVNSTSQFVILILGQVQAHYDFIVASRPSVRSAARNPILATPFGLMLLSPLERAVRPSVREAAERAPLAAAKVVARGPKPDLNSVLQKRTARK
jgi:hypothetical protein